LISTFQPYLVWHDVHVNREILDQLLGAAMFVLALSAGRDRSPRSAAALGVVSGLAILSNTRLLVLPLGLAAYLLWRGTRWSVPAPPNPPMTPTEARDIYTSSGRKVDVHECRQQSFYEHLVFRFWEHHPAEKAKLMAQATRLLWSPSVTADAGGPSSGGAFHAA